MAGPFPPFYRALMESRRAPVSQARFSPVGQMGAADYTAPQLPTSGQAQDVPDPAVQDFLSQYDAINGQPQQPNLIPTPGLNIGPVHLSGGGLDNAALSTLGMLQGFQQQPHGFAQALALGLAQGLAGSRARMAESRGAANQAAVQDAIAERKARASAAASFLAQHRLALMREANQKPTATTIHITADPNDPQRIAAKNNGIALPPGEFDAPLSLLTRDMPAATQPTAEVAGADDAAEMMSNGTLPPTFLQGRPTQYTLQVVAGLKKRGTNVSKLTQEWNAATAFTKNANSATQLRFRQALSAIPGLIGEVSGLNQQLKNAGIKENRIPIVNRAQLSMVRGGFADSPAAQSLVTRYRTAINAIPSEVGFAEMGGNAPTDKAMDRAVKQFNEAYSFEAANAALDEINRLASIRENTMNAVQAVMPSGGSGFYNYGREDNQQPPPMLTAPTPGNPAGKAFLNGDNRKPKDKKP